jgi:hypothetical protein
MVMGCTRFVIVGAAEPVTNGRNDRYNDRNCDNGKCYEKGNCYLSGTCCDFFVGRHVDGIGGQVIVRYRDVI